MTIQVYYQSTRFLYWSIECSNNASFASFHSVHWGDSKPPLWRYPVIFFIWTKLHCRQVSISFVHIHCDPVIHFTGQYLKLYITHKCIDHIDKYVYMNKPVFHKLQVQGVIPSSENDRPGDVGLLCNLSRGALVP